MARSLSFIVAALLTLSIGYAQGITGKWKGQMQTPNGAMDLVFNFKASGDSLAGTVEGPMGEMPIVNGKITGKTFTFDVNANDMTFSHQCTVIGDSISLKIPGMAGGEAMDLMLKRVTEAQKQSK